MTPTKRDGVIRFRAESELKARLEQAASKRNKKLPEFLRHQLWEIVQIEELAATVQPKAAGSRIRPSLRKARVV